MALRTLISKKCVAGGALGFRHQFRCLQTFSLPDLPYDYGALEPAISGEIMQLHHQKHHQAYVADYNKALEKLHDAINKGDYPLSPNVRALSSSMAAVSTNSIIQAFLQLYRTYTNIQVDVKDIYAISIGTALAWNLNKLSTLSQPALVKSYVSPLPLQWRVWFRALVGADVWIPCVCVGGGGGRDPWHRCLEARILLAAKRSAFWYGCQELG